MQRSWIGSLATLVVLIAPGSFATAQCPAPDGLDGGPCCTVAPFREPPFREFIQDSLSICWLECDVEAVAACRARWSFLPGYSYTPPVPFPPPVPPECRFRLQRLELFSATGALKWRGIMKLQYSRTWLETDTAGNDLQVWRFLVNGNLRPFSGTSPCPVPPCAPSTGNRVRYTGYVDYAKDCATAAYRHSWMLTHSCDAIDHAPGFPRAGAFHPDRAYTFVGPSAGFAVGPIQPVASGTSTLEAVRRVRIPASGPMECEFEEDIDTALDPFGNTCICGPLGAPPQYTISDFGLDGSCATDITTPGGPLLPGFLSMGIGAWTDPLVYPGAEVLRWNSGNYDYFDPCVGATRNEVFFGVTTLGGYGATQILTGAVGTTLPTTFVDQSNSLRAGVTTMNVIYESDHFLNLNF